MKNKILNIFAIACLVFFYGCNKINDGDFVKPISLYDNIQGSWIVSGVLYTDENAKSLGLSTDLCSKSIGSILNFNKMKLTFNVDSVSSPEKTIPTSYKVEGGAPTLFPTDGFWDMDNPYLNIDESPSHIILYADQGKTKKVAFISVSKRPAKKLMELTLIRSDNGIPYLSYKFSLIKK
jgi:hypothetical protein